MAIEKVTLKQNEEKRLVAGHQWVFSNEIASVTGKPAAGDTVELYSGTNKFMGVGFYNPHSLIAVRFLSRQKEEINKEFFVKRLLKALYFRKDIYPTLDSYRVVFGESDGLPGLIVDKYGSYLCVQMLSAGLEKNREALIEALKESFKPEGIIARNDSGLRALEGLEEKTEVLFGKVPEKITIEEGGCKFYADLAGGQKTGFFFDQRENRAVLAGYCKSKSLLDCFCHSGAFGIHAAKAGAKKVVWVDSSKSALALAGENAALNGLEGEFNGECADAAVYLAALKEKTEKFDIINIDPPGLIKNKKSFHAGYRLYLKLNTMALEALRPGGILATSSCSHHMGREDFRKMLVQAAADSGKSVRILEVRSQGRDHPALISMPETEYLKFVVLQVI
jgi:23S rRNA (cytosine1962-C5)-methyltransferase